jgi:uncharacterized protein
MIDPQLLDILVCPETRLPLVAADAGLLARLNRLASEGQLRNRRGNLVEGPIDDGLVRKDGRLLFRVVDGIPLMLIDEAISLEGGQDSHA